MADFATDLDDITRMLRAFRDELPGHVATDTDEEHVRAYLNACDEDGSLIYVLEPDVGLALGVVCHDWTRPVMICTDLAFFVLPEQRGKPGIASRLYERFESLARAAGAQQIIMTNQHPDYEDVADRFYRQHCSMAYVGGTYQKELCLGQEDA